MTEKYAAQNVSGHFVGSETSRVEVVIYPNHPSETSPVERKTLRFLSRPEAEKSITYAHVTSVQTTKQLGTAAGTFNVQIKSDQDLRDGILDGDWIDIIFTRGPEPYHVMRGIIVAVSKLVTATSGPSVATYTISGADFGHVFEEQGMWFELYSGADMFPLIANRIWATTEFANTPPDATVAAILRGFLLPTNNNAAGYRVLPKTMPLPDRFPAPTNAQGDRSFVDSYVFLNGYTHVPPRTSGLIPTSFTSSAHTVWDLAAEFSDPLLCEFFTDLVPLPEDPTAGRSGKGIEVNYPQAFAAGSYSPNQTAMAVVFRDSPFPNTIRDKADLLSAPYFSLPMTAVPPQHVSSMEVSHQGSLRKNTFFFGPALLQEGLPNYMEFQLPILDPESVKHHGMKRLDAQSRYITDPSYVGQQVGLPAGSSPTEAQAAQITEIYKGIAYDFRDIARDLHCLNHLLDAGTIELAYSMPQIRIGSRFRILGASQDEDFTCYVERVSHSWSYSRGSQTTLAVSHGWVGTDQSYVDKLKECVARYQVYTLTQSTPLDAKAGDEANNKWKEFAEKLSRNFADDGALLDSQYLTGSLTLIMPYGLEIARDAADAAALEEEAEETGYSEE